MHSSELLQQLNIRLTRSYVEPRFSALCAFLCRRAAGSVRSLGLALGGGVPSNDGALEQLRRSLAACGAGGHLQQLSLQLGNSAEPLPLRLAGSLWAEACGPGLQSLTIHGDLLHFDAALAGVTTLERLSLLGLLAVDQRASLPGSLLQLTLECVGIHRDLPTQVSCGQAACCCVGICRRCT